MKRRIVEGLLAGLLTMSCGEKRIPIEEISIGGMEEVLGKLRERGCEEDLTFGEYITYDFKCEGERRFKLYYDSEARGEEDSYFIFIYYNNSGRNFVAAFDRETGKPLSHPFEGKEVQINAIYNALKK